jgi:hypothetical protein
MLFCGLAPCVYYGLFQYKTKHQEEVTLTLLFVLALRRLLFSMPLSEKQPPPSCHGGGKS